MNKLIVDGQEVVFLREDGTEATNTIGQGGFGENGECLFYEILDKLQDGKVDGKLKFKRIIIQRVYPAIPNPELMEEKNV